MNIWIYIDGMQKGPFSEAEIAAMGLDPSTPVWAEGMEKWQPAAEVDFMAPLLGPGSGNAPENAAEEIRVEEIRVEVVESDPQPAPQGQNGTAAAAMLDEPCPPTYLAWSIVLLICCCSPVSLGAVISSICVSSFYSRGNLKGAKRASEIAAWLVMISIALGFLPSMFMLAFQ